LTSWFNRQINFTSNNNDDSNNNPENRKPINDLTEFYSQPLTNSNNNNNNQEADISPTLETVPTTVQIKRPYKLRRNNLKEQPSASSMPPPTVNSNKIYYPVSVYNKKSKTKENFDRIIRQRNDTSYYLSFRRVNTSFLTFNIQIVYFLLIFNSN
jgi:hypothetical protein